MHIYIYLFNSFQNAATSCEVSWKGCGYISNKFGRMFRQSAVLSSVPEPVAPQCTPLAYWEPCPTDQVHIPPKTRTKSCWQL